MIAKDLMTKDIISVAPTIKQKIASHQPIHFHLSGSPRDAIVSSIVRECSAESLGSARKASSRSPNVPRFGTMRRTTCEKESLPVFQAFKRS